MEQRISITKLLYNLLFNPIRTIKGHYLISYDKHEIDRYYYFSAIILGSLNILLKSGKESYGFIFLGLVLFPTVAFLGRWIISFFYFIVYY